MKNILTILLLLFLPWLSACTESEAWMSPVILGGGGGGVVCDDCSGTVGAAWHMESTAIEGGDPCGCTDNASKTVTVSGATLEGAQKNDGNYSLLVNATNEYASLPITSADIYDSAQGSLEFHVYLDTTTGNNDIFEAYGDANDYMRFRITATGIYYNHTSNGTLVTFTKNPSSENFCTDDVWCHVQLKWDIAAGLTDSDCPGHEMMFRTCPDNVCSDEDWYGEADSDDGTAFGTEPTIIAIGENQIGSEVVDGYYVDTFRISTSTSGLGF